MPGSHFPLRPLLPPPKLIRPIRPLSEHPNWELTRQILITRHIRMQIIPTIIQRIQLTRNLRIRKEPIEIGNRIESARFTDEFVDALACVLALRVTVGLDGDVGWGAERCDGCAEDGDAVGVDEGYHLLVGDGQGVVDRVLGGCCCWGAADVCGVVSLGNTVSVCGVNVPLTPSKIMA